MPAGRPHSRVERVGGGPGQVFSGGPSGGGFGGGGGRRSGGGMRRGGGLGLIGTVLALIFGLIGGFAGLGDSTGSQVEPYNTTYTSTASYSNTDESQVDRTVDSAARSKYTTIKGNGQDEVTLMLYIIGSDLESQSGMATMDLNEILKADLDNENLNIIVETGGASNWRNNVMSSRNIERWKVTSRGLQKLDTLSRTSMTNPGTLSSFIQFAAKEAPADRYMLILWDHGGGSVTGYGRDENYTSESMDTAEVADALKAGGVKFDFVGYDACLMATLENAIALEPYADYFIASEESEPGTGWYYTNWVTKLNDNTSTSTLDIGKQILDDYTSTSSRSSVYGSETTLSIVDLAELSGTIPEALANFGEDLTETLTSDHYMDVANARTNAKEFSASSRLDQVDLVDFCLKLDTTESNALAEAIQNAVKYNRAKGVSNAYGLSMYFPNNNLRYMNTMSKIYDEIGMDESFTGSVKQYATLESSGQIVTNSTGTSLFDLLTGGQYYSGSQYGGSYSSSDLYNMLGSSQYGNSGYMTTGGQYYGGSDYQSLFGGRASWMTDSMVRVAAGQLSNRALTPSDDMTTVRKDGHDVLELTEEQWSEIKAAEVNVFVPDTKNGGWLDLGLDNTAQFTDEGDMLHEWTENWITLDGNFAAMYPVSDLDEDGDGKYITTKYIPAKLNGERVNIIVEFNEETDEDTVLGAEKVYDIAVEHKGLIDIEAGDTIQLLCDHYTEDGSVKEEYNLGNSFTVGTNGLKLYSRAVSNSGCVFTYRLTDYYGAFYWLPLKSQ